MQFIRAKAGMEDSLTGIAIRSKAHWGYSEGHMKLWHDQLSINADYMEKNLVEVAINDGVQTGFYSINIEACELEDFWLLPEFTGTGLGKLMFQQVRIRMMELGISEITIISDPNAQGFYEQMGAVKVGEVDSAPVGRKLPQMKFSQDMYPKHTLV